MAPRAATKSKPLGPPVFMSISHYTRRACVVKKNEAMPVRSICRRRGAPAWGNKKS